MARVSGLIWAWLLLCGICNAISNESLLKEARKGGNNIIDVSGKRFKRILDSPRQSYILVHLTATAPQVGCSVCLETAEEYNTIVSSWFKDHPDGISRKDGEDSPRLFFAKADFKDPQNIPEIFTFYGLQHVPRYFLFAPGGDIHTYQIIELSGNAGMERTVNLINSIRSATNISDFTMHQPTDWSLPIISGVATFILVFIVKRHSNLLFTIAAYRPLWAIFWTSFIILMLGGHMYNSIRNAQLAGVGGNGEVMYFMPNQTQNQFKIETQIVGVVYGGLLISMVSLVLGLPHLKKFIKDSKSLPMIESFLSILLAITVYIFFAAFTAMFTIKQPGYPFSLLKFSSLFK